MHFPLAIPETSCHLSYIGKQTPTHTRHQRHCANLSYRASPSKQEGQHTEGHLILC